MDEEKFGFKNPEKLAHDLISGKDKKSIAKELVNQGEISEDHVGEYVDYFEQHLLSGSKFLGKNGGFFQETLNKYRNTPQGRIWLKNAYRKQMLNSLKWVLFCSVILVATFIYISLVERNKWIELFGGLVGVFGAIVGVIWTLIGFKRWHKIKN
jgi:hypothetical protein